MKFKRLIILMFVLITSIIISIKDVNASTEKIEIFFTVDGQRELTKSYLDSKSTTHTTYGQILMMDINVMSISGNNEGLSTLEFSIETNDIFQGIITTNPQTYERVVPNPDDDFFGYPKWSTNGSSSNNFIAVTEGGDDALIKPSPSKIATVIMRYNGDVVEENFEIKLTLEVAAHDSGTEIYDKSEISLPSIIIGDPNSTPDATLSALDITGTTTSKVYPFDVSATEVEGKITQNITIDYQDSIGGLTINPVFTKTSLGSSNYVKTESKASTNYQTGDTITITTTDVDQSKIYEIVLTVRSASTNTGIELKLAQGDSGTITFNSEKNRYEVVTPFAENDIKILATTAYPYATLDKNEIRVTNIEQDVFTHIGDFNVTAENGSTTTKYPVYVKREKGSSDASIKIITNEHPQGLAPVGNVFTINYPHTKTSLSFQIAKNQTGQTIKYKEVGTTTYITYTTTDIISKSSLETGSTYSYEVIVTPESQFTDEIVTYIVNFVIEPSNDTSIKTGDIKVQESGLTAINLNITNLVYTVSNNSSEFVTLTIDPGSKREAKIGEGTYQSAQLIHQISVASLNYGTNNFILTIKAQDGSEKEYTIKIEKKSDQAELEEIVFRTNDGTVIANLDDFTFISSENKYTYSFDYGLFPSNLKLETKTSAKSIIKGTTTNQLITPLDFSGNYEVITTTSLEVTSENGAVVKNYTIQITRTAADSNNDINAINIGGSPFTQFQIGDSNVTYNKVIVEPVGGIDTLNFEVLLPTTSKATVKVGPTTFTKNETGRYSTNIPFVRGIEQNVTIEVTAQNGEKNTIIIPFVVATNDTTLKTLNIEGTDFVFDPAKLNNTININYSFNSNVTITASPHNADSKVYIDGQVRVNDTYVKAIGSGTTTFKVWVESEAGTKGSEYVINIVRAQAKTDNNLESFVLKTNNGEIIDLGFLSSKTNYTITIDDREELWPLIYTAHVNEQNYAYIGTKGTTSLIDQQFNVSSGTISNLTIQVYSEGGVLKTYTISIKRANDVKTFESVTISGTGFVTQTFSADQFISGVLDIGNIAYNIDRLNVTFNMVDGSKSTIESIFIGNNQSGVWLFSKTGLIEEQFRVKSQAGNFGEYLKIRVNRQVAQTHKNLENLEVLVNGNNILLDFDPTTNTYTLRVDRQVSTVTILATVLSSDRSSVQTPFSLTDASGLNHIYTYTYNLNDPAAQPSNVIDIIVKAEDGTSNTYKVTIWRKNVEIGIDNIVIKNGSTVIYTGDILSVPNLGEFDFQTNQLTFIVTPKDSFARISFNGGTTLFADEDGLITYTHTLVVGTNQTITLRIQSDLLSTEYPIEAKSQNYHFTYTRNEASTLAELDSLEIIVGGTNLLDGVFDSSIIRYEGAYLRVDRTHMSVQIEAVGREFSTVTGLGIKEIKPGITNSYTVTVTSQSGTHSKEYTVYIVSKNDDHEINNIKVNSNDIGFIDSEFEYTLDNVLYTVSSLPIQVILNDTFANYYVNGVKNATSIPLVYGNNIIEIFGESEYGTKSGNTYRLNIYRNEPYKDTDISSLSITNISNGQNIVYKADGTNYLVELPDTSSISNVKVDIELKNTDKQVLESTFNLSNIALTYNGEGGLDQTITFKVNAEDNSTKTYQIRFVKNIILSSDNSLNNVSIKNQDNQVVTFPFDELLTNNSVVLNLPYSDNSLNIEITPTHNKAHVTPNKLNNVSLTVGENTFEFTITAEDGTVSAPYTITIHRQAASKDINLNNLTVTDPLNSGLYLLGLDTLSPKGLTFNPTTKTYNIKLDETYINEEIIINIVKGHIAQTITGPVNAPLTLNHGTNRFEIFIKAEDETVTQGKYTIIIEVLYKSNSLQSLTVDGQALTVQDINYFDTEKESVTITPVLTYPTHGSYVIKDSLGQVVTNTPSLNFDENIFTIEIKNEYGEIVKTHTLEITRLKSSEKTLSNVSLIGSNGTNYITFDPLTLTYTVEVPQNVEHVTLNATIPAKATATGLGEYIINLDETITITFKVTAEDGSESEIYTIYARRLNPSKEINLNNLTVTDPLNSGLYLLGLDTLSPKGLTFNPTTKTYNIKLDETYINEEIIINIVKGHIAQTITGPVNAPLTLNHGTNRFEIFIEAEDETVTQGKYTIIIEVLYKSNSLQSLTVDGQALTVQDINYFDTEKESVTITPVLTYPTHGSYVIKDSLGQVVTNTPSLNFDENIFTIEIKNEYGEIVKTHTLEITRLKSSEKTLSNVSLIGSNGTNYITFDPLTLTYTVEVPQNVEHVTLNATIPAKATATGLGEYIINLDETITITFKVTAEDGSESEIYTIYARRLNPSKEINLNNLTVTDPLNSGLYLLGLDTLSPKGLTFNPTTKTYNIKLDETYINEEIIINIVKGHIAQTITGPVNAPLTLNHGTNRFEIFIKAEDETVTQGKYTIIIEVLYKSNSLQSLTVDGQALTVQDINYFDTEKESVTITPVLTYPTHGSYVIKDSLGQVVTNTPSLNFDENIFTIEIKNEYGEIVKTHTLEITRLKSSEKTLSNVSLIGSNGTNYITFDPLTLTYTVEVPQNVEHVTLNATIPAKATATGLGEYIINLDETITITFKVTAEDGSESEIYTIYARRLNPSKEINLNNLTVTDPLNSGLYLLGLDTLSPKGLTFNPTTKTYNIKLDETYINEEIIINIVKGHIAQTITGPVNAPLTLNHGTNRFEIFIKAEDETVTQGKYTIIIEVLYKSNSLQSLTVDGQALTVQDINYFDTEKESVTITPVLTYPTHGSYVIKDSLGQVVTNTPSLNFDENIFTIEIKNEYGEIVKTHTLEITRLKSSEKTLSNVSLIGSNGTNYITFDPLTLTYTVEVPQNVEHVTLNATIPAKATATGLGEYIINLDETITITFKVTAEDGSESEIYTIYARRLNPSKEINLNNLTVTDPLNSGLYLLGLDTLSPKGLTFNPTTKTYNIKLDETYINEEIIINIVKGHIAQTITGPVNAPLTLNHGTNRFEIFIKAEDETVTQGKYTIIIEVLYKSNSLQSLTVDGQALTVQDINYFDTEKESVTITPVLTYPTHGSYVIKDSLGQVVTNTPSLNFDENIFTIEIKNEYGEIVKTHTLEITRLKSSEKTLSNVSLIGSNGTNYITFDPLTLTYTVEVPQNVEHVTLNATIPAKATATGLGEYIINLDETITITFKVTAEDGSESEIYTINITRRALSTNNHLEEISIIDTLDPTSYLIGLSSKNPDILFDKTTNNYVINLGLEYLDIKYRNLIIRYVKSDTYQTVDKPNPSTLTLNEGANVFVVTVLAEDSINTQPFIYTITINVLNKENDLKALTINGDVQDTSSNEIHYITEQEQANIIAESLFNDGSIIIKDKDGKVITSPLNLNMGENTISVEVLNAYQEVIEVYDVIITRLASSDNDFTATLTNETNTQLLNFDKDIETYNINVDYLTTEVTLAIVKNAKATSFGEGVYTLVSGETKEITFYVEAENGDVSPQYTIYITRLFNTDDKLANLGIKTNLEDLLTTDNFDPENNLYQFSLNEYHTNVTFSYVANYGQTLSGTLFDIAQPLTHGKNVFEIKVQPEDLNLEAFIISVEITIINSEIDLQNLFIDGVDKLLPGASSIRLDDVSSDKKTLDIEAVLTDLYGTVKINGNSSEHFIVDILPGENTITIEVTSEDGSTTKTYTVLVKQLLDDLDILDNILVTTQDNIYLLGDASVNPQIVFDALTNTYKFVVNETVEHIIIDIQTASTKQIVTGDLLIPLNIKHGMNQFEISVQPEDLNKPARTYIIEVQKVNDEILIDQLIVGQTDIYEEGVLDYVMNSVTNDQKTIKVIPMISNFGTYAIYDTKGNLVQGHDVNLSFGQNTIRIVFTSESGKTTKTITLTIEQTYSSDNQIIDVRFFDASTNINRLSFDPEITNYNIEFPASTVIARLRVETHNKALVFINDVQEINTRKDFNLISGNTITVKFYVVAENGDKGIEYTINVYKRKASDPVLSDNTNLYDVTIEVPIEEVHFDFDPSIYEYRVHIPYKYEEIYIKGHTESLGARVTNEGAYRLTPGVTKVIRLRVTAEDGTVAEKEYKFNITRALPNTDTTLKTLTIEDLNGNVLAFDQTTFNPENRTYNITLDDSMKLNTVNVLAEKNHETQTLYNTGIIQLHGEVEGYYNTIITVTVVAEDGSVGEYIIYVLHDLDFASLAEVKDISILGDDGISYFGLEFKNNTYVYEDILVPFNVDTTRLIVQTIGNVIYLDANNIEIEDNRLQSFGVGSQIVYRFRIESTNGSNTSEVYTIYVNRQQPDTNSLLETLEINGEMVRGFNPNIFEYTIVHPLQFEKYLDIYGVAQSDNSLVKGNDVYTLIEGQTRTITIEVKAESGDISSYKLHISYVNSNALLGELTVYEMIGEHDIQNTIPLLDDTLEYTIIIGKHTRYVNIKGFAKDQGGASIRGFGIREIGSEDTVVHITVTSGDGLEELTYVLTLRRDTSLSNLKEITSLQINGDDVINTEDDPYIYRYEMSNNSSKINLSAITNNTSRIAINGGEFSHHNKGETEILDVINNQVVRISVMAEDGSIQHYMVIIELPEQPNMLLTILLILSILLWVVTTMIYILKRIKNKNKKDRNQLIF